MSGPVHHFKSGDVVEVLSLEEIAATLDEHGGYESLPFTAEMRQFCGRRFRVFKRADKICVETTYFLALRRMRDAVTLEEVALRRERPRWLPSHVHALLERALAQACPFCLTRTAHRLDVDLGEHRGDCAVAG
jgi:hypothetical protein